MENIGICLPDTGYLPAVREITQRYGTMLIFDEVKTGLTRRLRRGDGSTSGCSPISSTLAKSIGGGFPGRCLRRPPGPDGPDHRRQGAAPRHLQRQTRW